MTINEQIQYKLDKGYTLDEAINEIARAEYFRMLHEANMPDDEYAKLVKKRKAEDEKRRKEAERPLLDWVENKI